MPIFTIEAVVEDVEFDDYRIHAPTVV